MSSEEPNGAFSGRLPIFDVRVPRSRSKAIKTKFEGFCKAGAKRSPLGFALQVHLNEVWLEERTAKGITEPQGFFGEFGDDPLRGSSIGGNNFGERSELVTHSLSKGPKF